MKLPLLAVLAFLLIAVGPASATTIHDFGRMNNDDEATLVTTMVEGAAKHLKEQGHPDQAAQTLALFHVPGPKGGVYQLAGNLKAINTLNNRNATNPNNRAAVLEIEDAMELTLKDHDIIVPAAYLHTLTKDFHPVGPPRSYATGK